ncbi:MAG: methyltransferase domain-containing protein, partial [Myxococcales bacterium]
MSERTATEFLNLRLPLYAYTAPLWQGRRVLEIGCGDGGSAEYLGSHGAERVLSVDTDAGRIDRARARHSRARVDFRAVSDLRQIATIGAPGERIDVVLAPEGQLLLATPALITDIRRLLGETGHLIAAVPAADRKGRMAKDGVGYYDLADALAERFPVLRMLGQTPFLGFGLVEFDGSADALRVDVSLLQSGAEQPSHYVGIAGAAAPPSLGYSLVQVPFAPVEAVIFGAEAGASGALPIPAREAAPPVSDARLEMAERRLEESERRARARLEEAETRLSDLRRKLEEALVQAESSVRVSRAQAEEIQELRARIRRGSEDRAAADDELSKLRRALAQADESVLTLTRRTAEEMAVVAEKMVTGLGRGNTAAISAGVAGDSAGKSGANAAAEQAERAELEERARRAEAAASRDHAEIATLTERIRIADEQIRALKQKSAAVAERDDRIARLEGDKQDLLWRVAELEEKLRHAAADAAGRGQQKAHPDQVGARDDQGTAQQVAAARQARDRAIEELHRAAAAHGNEVHQLRSSVAEQAALVAELEDAVRAAEARAAAADKEATTLRRNAKELEEADRTRRGRLAELEGKLLRLERERSLAAASGVGGGGTGTDDGALADLKQRLAATEQRAVVAEQRVTAAEERAQAQAKAQAKAQATPAPGAAGANNGHPGAGTPTGLS